MTAISPVLSYMLPVFRPWYSSRVICQVVRKTTLPYELLLWFNCADEWLEAYVRSLIAAGAPIRIVGRTPENIGMKAFQRMALEAKGDLMVQLEDDAIDISRNAGEIALDLFQRYPEAAIIGGHVWQDVYTTGARPPLHIYEVKNAAEGLYQGPMDGPLMFYKRPLCTPIFMEAKIDRYFGLGPFTHGRIMEMGYRGYLTTRIMSFHMHGPIYHWYYGMLDHEIAKYEGIHYYDMANTYKEAKKSLPPKQAVADQIERIAGFLETFGNNPDDWKRIPPSPPPLPDSVPSFGQAGAIDRPGYRGWWSYA